MYETINESLRNNFYNNELIQKSLQEYEQRVLRGEKTSFAAAHDLLDIYYK